jgi:hypothetical protein
VRALLRLWALDLLLMVVVLGVGVLLDVLILVT